MNKNIFNKIYLKTESIFWDALSLLLYPVSRATERNFNKKSTYQPIFIIGAPRTGSTILYQILSNDADMIYINNLNCKMNKSFFLSFLISKFMFKTNSHESFESVHGDTNKSGLNAPSECGEFWYKWLPKYQHYAESNDLSSCQKAEIKREVNAVSNYFKKPLLFKNLAVGQRLKLVKDIFPNAKFIFVRRNPLDVAMSILKAKKRLKLKPDFFWSIKPKNYHQLKKMAWNDQIINQIYSLEKQIVKDLNLFPKENICEIWYESFSEKSINSLLRKLGITSSKIVFKDNFVFSSRSFSESEEVKLLKQTILKKDWSKIEL